MESIELLVVTENRLAPIFQDRRKRRVRFRRVELSNVYLNFTDLKKHDGYTVVHLGYRQ